MGFKDIFKRSEDPFFDKEKRADFERLRKAGYDVKTAKALVESSPKYQDDEEEYGQRPVAPSLQKRRRKAVVRKQAVRKISSSGTRITAKRPKLR